MYFLIIACLIIIGTYTTLYMSPMSPWSTLVVLSIVVSISVIKNGLEDMKRHEADREINNRITKRLQDMDESSDDLFDEIRWKDLQVGNIVKILKNQEIPADMILLTTSENLGIAYVETSNIDGEANLKVKCSVPTGEEGIPAWSTEPEVQRFA